MKLDGLASPSWAARARAAHDIWGIAGEEVFWNANIEGSEERVYFHEIVDSLLEHGDAFIALVEDPAARVRRPACGAIAKVAQLAWDDSAPDETTERLQALVVRARPALLRVAAGDPHPRIRAPAIDALARLGPPVAGELELLLKLAAEDPSARVRARAVRALGRKSRSLERDLALVVDDRELEVEDAMIDVLKEQRSELILPILWRRLAADPDARHHVETEDGSSTSWPLIDIVRRYPLDPARARSLMLALIDREKPDHDAIEAIAEYVDPSCIDVLTRIAKRGDYTSTHAMTALTRLGADAPLDAFAYWLEPDRELTETWGDRLIDAAILGLAATERARPSDLELVVRLFERRHFHQTLKFAFALDDPRIAAAAERHRSAHERDLRVAALALGCAGDPDTPRFIERLGRRREPLTRVHTAIAIALVDPSQVPYVDHGWPTRVPSHLDDGLVLALALRELGRRLHAPLVPNVRVLVDGALRFAGIPIDRSDGSSALLLRDLLQQAGALLRRH